MPPSRKYSDPDAIAQISDLALRSRRLVEGAISGQHRSPFHGFNVEFAEYREYTPGDDLRRLDWRVFARSDRHYIKQYEEESNVRVTFVVDASKSMNYRRLGARSPSSIMAPRWSSRWRCCWCASKTRSAWCSSMKPRRRCLPPGGDPGADHGHVRPARKMPAVAEDRAGRPAPVAVPTSSAAEHAGDRLGPLHRPRVGL